MNDTVQSSAPRITTPPAVTGSAKETEAIRGQITRQETLPIEEITQPQELSSEVKNAGVSLTNTGINLPPEITSLGIAESGPDVRLGTGESVILQLSRDEIVKGRQASPHSSIRFFAEWFQRQLDIIKQTFQSDKKQKPITA